MIHPWGRGFKGHDHRLPPLPKGGVHTLPLPPAPPSPQMGRGRTTTGMIIASLLYLRKLDAFPITKKAETRGAQGGKGRGGEGEEENVRPRASIRPQLPLCPLVDDAPPPWLNCIPPFAPPPPLRGGAPLVPPPVCPRPGQAGGERQAEGRDVRCSEEVSGEWRGGRDIRAGGAGGEVGEASWEKRH